MRKTVLTKEGFEKMKQKLNEKIQQMKSLRDEKAHAYSASGDGWHDNPGWVQLGQQEEMLANEVNILQQKINNATIIDSPKVDESRVQIGSKVNYLILKPNGVSTIHSVYIVGSGESDVKNKKISYDSPVGKALFKMEKGEEKEVELPAGRIIVRIESIIYE